MGMGSSVPYFLAFDSTSNFHLFAPSREEELVVSKTTKAAQAPV